MERIINQIGSKNSPVVIELKEFEGRKIFDIRKYFFDKKSNELAPTRKGIALNSIQLQGLIETINDQSKEIKTFLFDDDNEFIDINTSLKFENLLGRSFKCEFENGKTSITLDQTIFGKIQVNEQIIVKKMILSFTTALLEVMDDQEEMDLILDRMDQKIRKIK